MIFSDCALLKSKTTSMLFLRKDSCNNNKHSITMYMLEVQRSSTVLYIKQGYQFMIHVSLQIL